MQRRYYRDGVELSIIGFGGMVVVGMDQKSADALVAESFDRGVNYFDAAPFYGDGEAEQKVGIALEPFREKIFLSCKTLRRSAAGAREELERSLCRLRSTHFDLYQFHAVTKGSDVEAIFAPGGAMDSVLEARQEGKVRFIGFSAHSVEAALAMLDRFKFDSILFPINYVCYAKGNFGPQVIQKAKELGVARIALKALALGPCRKGEKRTYPKCWYRPISDHDLALQAIRFAFSENVTSIIPPADEGLFRMVLDFAADVRPMTTEERIRLIESAQKLQPLMRFRKKIQ